jgi:hypothetical protein
MAQAVLHFGYRFDDKNVKAGGRGLESLGLRCLLNRPKKQSATRPNQGGMAETLRSLTEGYLVILRVKKKTSSPTVITMITPKPIIACQAVLSKCMRPSLGITNRWRSLPSSLGVCLDPDHGRRIKKKRGIRLPVRLAWRISKELAGFDHF